MVRQAHHERLGARHDRIEDHHERIVTTLNNKCSVITCVCIVKSARPELVEGLIDHLGGNLYPVPLC